jgi:MFS family permease
LSGAIALVGLALGCVLPLSSLRLEQAGYASGVIGALLALHALGLVLAMPLTRLAVAHVGARRTLPLAGSGAALVCIAMQDATSTPAVAIALLLLGILLGLVFNVVETWVNDILPDAARGRWLAIHCTVFTVFQLAGPLLLQVLPVGQAYRCSGLLLLLTVPASYLLSNRPLGGLTHDHAIRGWWQIVLHAPAVVWATMLFALFDAVVLGILPLYARLLGASPAEALLSASVVLAGDAALEWVIGALADRYGRLPMQLLCGMVLLGGAPMLPLLIGGAAGGIYVLALMASGQRFAGSGLLQVTSLLGASWGVGSCAGPLLTGVLMHVNLSWALPAVLATGAAVLLVALAWEETRLQPSPVAAA